MPKDKKGNGNILNPDVQTSAQRAETTFKPMHVFNGEVTGEPVVAPPGGIAPPKTKALRMSCVGYNLITNRNIGQKRNSMGETGFTSQASQGGFLTANKYDVSDILKGNNTRLSPRFRGMQMD